MSPHQDTSRKIPRIVSPDLSILFVSGDEAVAAPVDTSKCDISSLAGAEKRRMMAAFTVPKDLKPGSYDLYLRVSAPLKDEQPGNMPFGIVMVK